MEFWINVLNGGLIIAVFAVSLNVIMGVAGQLSIAPAGLGGIGGYTAALLAVDHGWSFGPSLAAGTGAAFVAGVLIGVPALRLSVEYVILLTLAFATVVVAVFQAIPALGGAYGLVLTEPVHFGGALLEPSQFLRLNLLVAVICCAICWRLTQSPFGRVLRGIREDGEAMDALGKNVVVYKIATFALTSAIAGAAGVMLVYNSLLATPGQFTFTVTTTIVAAVILGGIGSLSGAFIGALVLSFIGPVLQKAVDLDPAVATLWQLVIFGVLLIVVMRLRPDGLIPEGTSLRRIVSRRQPQVLSLSEVQVPARTDPQPLPQSHRPEGDAGDHGRQRAEGDAAVVATGLVKHFGGIRAVHGLDITLAAGRITALVGPNGAGKTTVFNLLTGRIRPDVGTVELWGRDITGLPPHRVTALGMSRSFQDVRTLRRLTLIDNVAVATPGNTGERLGALFARPYATSRAERAARAHAMEFLEFVGLEDRANQRAGDLGYGDQKLLAIARVLATGAEVLLVDEPAAGIDRANLDPVLLVLERLRDAGRTTCIVEHNLDVVSRLSDHVIFMEQGRASVEGRMEDIVADEQLAEVYFGHV